MKVKCRNSLLGYKRKKFRSPLSSTLKQAAGALTHRTGRNLSYRDLGHGHKKGRRLTLTATLSPVSNGRHRKVGEKI
jgi:hypothetical protein